MTESVDWTLLLVRFSHYAFGMLWLGMAFFSAFVMPRAMEALEPEARAKINPALAPRVMAMGALGATATLLTGLWLLHRIYGPLGLAHARGAWAAAGTAGGLAMFLTAVAVAMPTSIRLTRAARGEQQADVPALTARLRRATTAVALLGFPSVFCMMLAAGHPAAPFGFIPLSAVLLVSAAIFFLIQFVASRAGRRPG